jgi:hypothetical protein
MWMSATIPSRENNFLRVYARSGVAARLREKRRAERHPFTCSWLQLDTSPEGIERWPEIALGTIRLLGVSTERIELGAELRHTGDEVGERLPERNEESPLSGSLGPLLLSGERREGEEGKDEEDDGDMGPRPSCVRHGGTSLPGDVRSDPGAGGRGHPGR